MQTMGEKDAKTPQGRWERVSQTSLSYQRKGRDTNKKS